MKDKNIIISNKQVRKSLPKSSGKSALDDFVVSVKSNSPRKRRNANSTLLTGSLKKRLQEANERVSFDKNAEPYSTKLSTYHSEKKNCSILMRGSALSLFLPSFGTKQTPKSKPLSNTKNDECDDSISALSLSDMSRLPPGGPVGITALQGWCNDESTPTKLSRKVFVMNNLSFDQMNNFVASQRSDMYPKPNLLQCMTYADNSTSNLALTLENSNKGDSNKSKDVKQWLEYDTTEDANSSSNPKPNALQDLENNWLSLLDDCENTNEQSTSTKSESVKQEYQAETAAVNRDNSTLSVGSSSLTNNNTPEKSNSILRTASNSISSSLSEIVPTKRVTFEDIPLETNKANSCSTDKGESNASTKRRREAAISYTPKECDTYKKKLRKVSENQMLLDFGQNLPPPEICTTCGFFSTHSSDQFEHTRFHNRFTALTKYTHYAKERILQEFADGFIMAVFPNCSAALQKKANDVKWIVDDALGYAPDTVFPSTSQRVVTFLFISPEKRAVGYLLAEQISEAYRIIPDPENSKSCTCSTQPEEAVCGVSRIWVAHKYRKKRIATRLLNAMRIHFLYGVNLMRDQIAMSDPTSSGHQLGIFYFKRKDFLVYKYGQPTNVKDFLKEQEERDRRLLHKV